MIRQRLIIHILILLIEGIGHDKATINHTYTDPAYRGHGIADKLLELVVKKLQQEKREIIPLCSFAKNKLNN